ncbi:nucleotide exchange factor GrpE [bacterium]|nr:nucleotide exchange factor GrpE [bacterium]
MKDTEKKENETLEEVPTAAAAEAGPSAAVATEPAPAAPVDPETAAEPTPEAAPVPELSELEQAQAEAAEMKTRYLRAVADLENYRKRIGREKQDILRSAAAGVIEALLPVLDNMKLGLQAAENHPEAKDVTIGFKMVEDQLRRTLTEQGLEELIPDGEAFNPNLHECIAHQPSDEVAEDHVIQTVRAGYRLNERLIRAANVIVSSGTPKEET